MDSPVVRTAPINKVMAARGRSFQSPIMMAKTAVRRGWIHGATTMAPITTAALLASNPRLAIRLAPKVSTTNDSLSAASPS